MKRISELDHEPEVGKFYLVPCIRRNDGTAWIPVVGPMHDDKEIIGVEAQHYHRDVRFMTEDDLEYLAWRVTEPTAAEYGLVQFDGKEHIEKGPVERRMKCRRRMPDFPLTVRYRHPLRAAVTALWFRKLEQAYAEASAKCGRCPHRGMPLKNLPVKDGKIICNGHGLQFDAETGALVPRDSEDAT